MKNLIFLLVLLAGCKRESVTNKYAFGAIADSPGDISKIKTYSGSLRNEAALLPPVSFKLDMPPIANQGGEGSCVSFAVGYYALSIAHHYKTGLPYAENINVFSPEYLYDNVHNFGCYDGSTLYSNLTYIRDSGNVLWSTMPYSSSNGCDIIPTSFQMNEAMSFSIGEYSKVPSSDTSAIKSILMGGNALPFNLTTDEHYINGDGTKDYVWKEFGMASGLHCNVIVGWDDSKNAWLAANQWGTGWQNNGFIWIDYNFFTTLTGYAYFISSWNKSIVPPQDTIVIVPSDTVVLVKESSVISATTSTIKGKITDVVKWGNVLNYTPINSEIQYATDGINFSTLYKILPYNSTGTYGYNATRKKRYYRLKTLKADNNTIYSQIISIQ